MLINISNIRAREEGKSSIEIPQISNQLKIRLAFEDARMRVNNAIRDIRGNIPSRKIADYHYRSLEMFKLSKKAWGGAFFEEFMGSGSWMDLGGYDTDIDVDQWKLVKALITNQKANGISAWEYVDALKKVGLENLGDTAAALAYRTTLATNPELIFKLHNGMRVVEGLSEEEVAERYNVPLEMVIENYGDSFDGYGKAKAFKTFTILPDELLEGYLKQDKREIKIPNVEAFLNKGILQDTEQLAEGKPKTFEELREWLNKAESLEDRRVDSSIEEMFRLSKEISTGESSRKILNMLHNMVIIFGKPLLDKERERIQEEYDKAAKELRKKMDKEFLELDKKWDKKFDEAKLGILQKEEQLKEELESACEAYKQEEQAKLDARCNPYNADIVRHYHGRIEYECHEHVNCDHLNPPFQEQMNKFRKDLLNFMDRKMQEDTDFIKELYKQKQEGLLRHYQAELDSKEMEIFNKVAEKSTPDIIRKILFDKPNRWQLDIQYKIWQDHEYGSNDQYKVWFPNMENIEARETLSRSEIEEVFRQKCEQYRKEKCDSLSEGASRECYEILNCGNIEGAFQEQLNKHLEYLH